MSLSQLLTLCSKRVASFASSRLSYGSFQMLILWEIGQIDHRAIGKNAIKPLNYKKLQLDP